MSRIIKFRRPYFSDTTKDFVCFGYWGQIDGGFISPPHISGCHYKPDSDQQFTNLHNKKGKEIYEGDIAKVMNWTPSGSEPTYSNMVVEWIRVEASDDMGTNMIGFIDHSFDEIIGNIYENPELLKASP